MIKTNGKGFPLHFAIPMSAVLVIIGVFALGIWEKLNPMIAYNNDGSRMSVYANVITTFEGLKYRVTVSTHYEPGKKPVRIVDMYTLDDKLHANVTGIMRDDFGSWNEIYHCSDDEIRKTTPSCPHNDFIAERLLNEAMKKTIVRENIIGNMELMWSWEMGTKEIINQIKNLK